MRSVVRSIPNVLTTLRIIGAVCLMFIEPLTGTFYIVYTFSGVSDALDGFIARRLHCASELGAALDSVSDLLFYAAMFLRVLPVLWRELSWRLWVFACTVLLVRLSSYITAAVKYRRFSSMHTYLNKLTGVMVFLVPYAMHTDYLTAYCVVLGIVGFAGSTEELVIHLSSGSYDGGRKSLLIQPSNERHAD